jgi:hypothetical protein
MNVAMAGTVLLYEAARQRRPDRDPEIAETTDRLVVPVPPTSTLLRHGKLDEVERRSGRRRRSTRSASWMKDVAEADRPEIGKNVSAQAALGEARRSARCAHQGGPGAVARRGSPRPRSAAAATGGHLIP